MNLIRRAFIDIKFNVMHDLCIDSIVFSQYYWEAQLKKHNLGIACQVTWLKSNRLHMWKVFFELQIFLVKSEIQT